MDAISSIFDLVESLQRRGRYAFTRAEVATALSLSDEALTKGLQRLARKDRVRMLRRGFFVIIPVEYSATGMIPTDWFIAELMQFLDLPYYIGVLSAAALHGAAHQQPQEYHVVREQGQLENLGLAVEPSMSARIGSYPWPAPRGSGVFPPTSAPKSNKPPMR